MFDQENITTGDTILPFIEFTQGKLGIIRQIKWDPEIGAPVFRERFIFRDEFGEDWGTVKKGIAEPEHSEPEHEQVDEQLEEGGEVVNRVIDGVVVRYVTAEDIAVLEQIALDEVEYLKTCIGRVKHHELQMKMLGTDIRFDRRKVTFHFGAEGRVDFRMLVRDLASIFRCRIELHQIGARDEAKLYVGCGACGRGLCCRTWLAKFDPIGIKMARAQNLPLNPGKISGNCGRLLCCLGYEYENYLEMAETLPKIGDHREVDGVEYEVTYVSPLSQTVTLQCLNPDERFKRVRCTSEEYYSGHINKK
ncbi:MAG: regulatory iron-sulfur-containing complex subunit RicT [bacterium]|nr:regulatory iron-sulfur-containing complex subunit RicT [bacterium]